jgi:hypothetical protein
MGFAAYSHAGMGNAQQEDNAGEEGNVVHQVGYLGCLTSAPVGQIEGFS